MTNRQIGQACSVTAFVAWVAAFALPAGSLPRIAFVLIVVLVVPGVSLLSWLGVTPWPLLLITGIAASFGLAELVTISLMFLKIYTWQSALTCLVVVAVAPELYAAFDRSMWGPPLTNLRPTPAADDQGTAADEPENPADAPNTSGLVEAGTACDGDGAGDAAVLERADNDRKPDDRLQGDSADERGASETGASEKITAARVSGTHSGKKKPAKGARP